MRRLCDVRIDHDENNDVWATVGARLSHQANSAKAERPADLTMPSIGLITQQTIAGADCHGDARFRSAFAVALHHGNTRRRLRPGNRRADLFVEQWTGTASRAVCTGLYGRRAFSALAACRSTT